MEHDIIHLLRHLKMLISNFNIYNIESGKLYLTSIGSFLSKKRSHQFGLSDFVPTEFSIIRYSQQDLF